MDVGIRIRFFTHKAPLWDGYDASYYYPSKNFKIFKVLFAHDFYVHRTSINRPYRTDVEICIRFSTHKASRWDAKWCLLFNN